MGGGANQLAHRQEVGASPLLARAPGCELAGGRPAGGTHMEEGGRAVKIALARRLACSQLGAARNERSSWAGRPAENNGSGRPLLLEARKCA